MSKRRLVPVFILVILVGAAIVLNRGELETGLELNETGTQPTTPEEPPTEPEPETPEDEPVEEPVKPLRGVSLSPEAYTTDEFLRFFQVASESGEFISWVGDVAFLENTGSAPYILHNLEDQYDFDPMIITGYFSQSSGELHRELNETNKQYMIDVLVDYATEYDPDYLGFGVEINIFAKSNPEAYQDFVLYYDMVYAAVKEANPSTKFFTVFQLEQIKGLDGGLFGGVNDPEQNTWDTLNDFKSDLAVFTTYPCLIYKDPSEIPADYYTEITEHTSKTIAFTEMGWYRNNITGWESSMDEQIEFIEFYFNATSTLDIEFETWSFLYDPETFAPFDSMGLLRDGETSSTVLDAWKKR